MESYRPPSDPALGRIPTEDEARVDTGSDDDDVSRADRSNGTLESSPWRASSSVRSIPAVGGEIPRTRLLLPPFRLQPVRPGRVCRQQPDDRRSNHADLH